jgi:Tfp pilus assembly protein PilN
MLISGFNLAASNYRRSRREVILATSAVAALTLLLLGQIALWGVGRREGQGIGDRLARMEGEFRRHQEKVRAVQASVPGETLKRYEAKVGVYNQILEASAFSWTGLLVELERALPPFVYLSEIHPDLATGQVGLRGVARSFDDLSLFLRGLEERTAFRDVFLLQQADRKAASGGQDGLEFRVNLVVHGRRR